MFQILAAILENNANNLTRNCELLTCDLFCSVFYNLLKINNLSTFYKYNFIGRMKMAINFLLQPLAILSSLADFL